jgi:hypothetical protein
MLEFLDVGWIDDICLLLVGKNHEMKMEFVRCLEICQCHQFFGKDGQFSGGWFVAKN